MTVPLIYPVIYFIGATFLAYQATAFLIGWLTKRNIMAVPTARSSHTSDTPVGGGWVIFVLTFLAWSFSILPSGRLTDFLVLGGMICLALISWADDRRPVSSLLRFAIQILVIATVLLSLPEDKMVFANLVPLPLDRLLTGLLWLWFINLYNFMDGIDGLAGSQTLFIAASLALLSTAISLPSGYLPVLIVIAGSCAGFLYWNWQPAKIFMGDIGSITMGFVLGWLLITIALEGYLVTALLLPLYFIVDASWTLLRRIIQKEKFLRPHRTHIYQKAALASQSHALIVRSVMLANLFLLASAVRALYAPLTAILLAAAVMAALLLYLYSLSEKRP